MTLPLHVCIINLTKRSDRWEKIQQHLQNLKQTHQQLSFVIQIHRVEAVDNLECPGKGCMSSHKKALQLAQDQRWPYVMVMEDDARFEANIDHLWSLISEDLIQYSSAHPQDWGVIFGATLTLNIRHTKYVSPRLLSLHKNGIFTGTHCMIYHHQSYAEIINLIDEELLSALPYHIDLLLSLKFNGPILLTVPFLALFTEHDFSNVRVGKETKLDYEKILSSRDQSQKIMNFFRQRQLPSTTAVIAPPSGNTISPPSGTMNTSDKNQ